MSIRLVTYDAWALQFGLCTHFATIMILVWVWIPCQILQIRSGNGKNMEGRSPWEEAEVSRRKRASP